jgi:hypothetical protein
MYKIFPQTFHKKNQSFHNFLPVIHNLSTIVDNSTRGINFGGAKIDIIISRPLAECFLQLNRCVLDALKITIPIFVCAQ